MEYCFSEQDILKAKDVYLYDKGILYIVDANDNAYGYGQGGGGWFFKRNFWDYFESEMMLVYFDCISREEAVRLYRKWRENTGRTNEAD